MKIIPAVDLIGGKTVRLEQGDYDKKLSYDIDPVDAAIKWASLGAELLHIVDLDGARAGQPVNLAIIEEIIRETATPIEVGGGYREKCDIDNALDMGVSRVIIGSKAFQDPLFAKEAIETFGDKVILSCDARNFSPSVEGWEKDLEINFFEMLRQFVSYGAKEMIYTDISRDGTLTGPAVSNIEKILDEVDVKIVSAGGVKEVSDIVKLKPLEKKGLTGVIVGRALYDGTIDLVEAIDAGKTDNTVS